MAALFFDECMGRHFPARILRYGHDVKTTVAAGRVGKPDYDQLLYAYQSRRILVTQNVRDFAYVHDAWLAWARPGWVAPMCPPMPASSAWTSRRPTPRR